ncbi:MAG: hypothetical protein ACLGH0_03365 [Thermoanaerobaculia bacterium]
MKRMLCLAAIALVLAAPAFAQRARSQAFASDFQTIPVMGNTPGAGATFQTFVALMNPTSSAYPVEVSLYDVNGTKRTATINLAAGELKTYPNFLDAVFNGYVGGGAVTFKSPSPSNRFIVDVEVWTSGERYGTSIPPLEFAGTDSRSYAIGISVDSLTRTNIGCFNQTNAANTVTATVKDKSGAATISTITLNLPANAWRQAPVSSIVTDGYVVFDPSDAAVCYAVVVTNSTDDGRFIPATEFEP